MHKRGMGRGNNRARGYNRTRGQAKTSWCIEHEPTTYVGQKEATNRQIVALLGTKVSMSIRRTEKLKWVVVEESKTVNIEVTKESIGLSNYSQGLSKYSQLTNDAQLVFFLSFLFEIHVFCCRTGK
jgi:hypothetical protein